MAHGTWLRSLGECAQSRREVMCSVLLLSWLSCATHSCRKGYLDLFWNHILHFRRNEVIESSFIPTLLHVCFLVGEDNSAGDAFVMFTVVFWGPALPNV